jgi:hypothetical protein
MVMDAQTSHKQFHINEHDIGKAASDWTCDYNKKMQAKQAVLVYVKKVSI